MRRLCVFVLLSVLLMTVSGCVVGRQPVMSRELPLEPKSASGIGHSPQPPAPGEMQTPDAAQAPAGQVRALPPLASSSWQGDLRTLPPGKTDHRTNRPRPVIVPATPGVVTKPKGKTPPIAAQEFAPDAVAQTSAPDAAMPAPLSSFLGLTFNTWGDGWPPDTNGDVGPVYYIQTVNTSVGIFNKNTGALVTAFSFDALMSQGFAAPHPCNNKNYGDPIVVWDPAADRWILSDFAFNIDGSGNPIAPTYECIAVSQTSDPVAGGWHFYALASNDYFADYPKMGIWPGGLYITANMFGYGASGSFQVVRAWAMNTTQMYAGQAASVQTVDLPASIGGVSVFSALPATYHTVTGAPPRAATTSLPPSGRPKRHAFGNGTWTGPRRPTRFSPGRRMWPCQPGTLRRAR